MLFIDDGNIGWRCVDMNSSFQIMDDENHKCLFNYVDTDLSKLAHFLWEYINNRITLTSIGIEESYLLLSMNSNPIEEIKSILIHAHPFYRATWPRVFANELCEMYTKIMAFRYNTLIHEHATDDDFGKYYRVRLMHLLKPISAFIPVETYIQEEYSKFLKIIENSSSHINKMDLSDIKATGFNNECAIQNAVRIQLYTILDIGNKHLSHLSIPQRIIMYSRLFHNNGLNVTAERKLILMPHKEFSIEYLQNSDINKLPQFDKVAKQNNPSALNDHTTSNRHRKAIIPDELWEVYEISDIQQLLQLEILSMIKHNVMIRRCKYCGKYFVTMDKNTQYCNRMIDRYGRHCSDTGKYRIGKKKLSEDKYRCAYNKAYKHRYYLIKAGKLDRAMLDEWRIEAKSKLKAARACEITFDEFQEWLAQE